MKKLTSMIDQVENLGFSEAEIAKAKKAVSDALKSTDVRTNAEKYSFWKITRVLSGLLTCVFMLLFIIFKFLFKHPWTTEVIIYFVLCIVMFILLVTSSYQKDESKEAWDGDVKKPVGAKYNEILKTLIENKYENLKVLGAASDDTIEIIDKHRTNGVDTTAHIIEDYGGLDFSINGRVVTTRRVLWHWTKQRYNPSTKSYETVSYYMPNFYIISKDFHERFASLNLVLGFANLLDNRGHELENESFNKMFSYVHDDPVGLRVLFTPFVQETFVENLKKIDPNESIRFVKTGTYYTLVKYSGETPFDINTKVNEDINIVISAVTADLVSDAISLMNFISVIATIRELVE